MINLMVYTDGNDDDKDDDEDDNENDDAVYHDFSTEKLFLIESKIVNSYLLLYMQSGTPRSKGFVPAIKRK